MKLTLAVFRGVGQVFLQENAASGALFLLAVAFSSLYSAIALLAGSFIGTTAASVIAYMSSSHIDSASGARPSLKIETQSVIAGVHGFNGALTAVALNLFLSPSYTTAFVITVACIVTVPVMMLLTHALRRWQLPALTAPFLLVSFACLIAYRWLNSAAAQSSTISAVSLSSLLPAIQASAIFQAIDRMSWFSSALKGLSQVFFQESSIAGLLILIGLLLSSPLVATAALAASASGAATGLLLNAQGQTLSSGLLGFNAALVAVALIGVFPNVFSDSTPMARARQLVTTVAGSIVSTILYLILTSGLQTFSLPTLTVPFVVTVWLFALAGRAIWGLSFVDTKSSG